MAFGKGALFFLFIMAVSGVSMAVVHRIGDIAGWTMIPLAPVDYQKWASSRNFYVGDVLVFRYNKLFHNVVRVTHQNFKSCNTTFPFEIYTSGFDNIQLTRPGHYFFICGFPGHCLRGQKVHLEVSLKASASGVDHHNHFPLSANAEPEAFAPIQDSLEPAPAPGPAQSGAAYSFGSFSFWSTLSVLALGLSVNAIDF